MPQINDAAERRKQSRLHRLGTNRPVCPSCGEARWQCFEMHHIAGRKFDPQEIPLCMNCHAVCSDLQKDHPAKLEHGPTTLETIGRYLLGLADVLGLIIGKLREFGLLLIEAAVASESLSAETTI